MSTKNKLLLLVIVLIAVNLACVINVGGPEQPYSPVPVSTDAVQTLIDSWKTAFEDLDGDGAIVLTLTETQLTSLLSMRLTEQENPILSDPQVYLRDGEIQVYGVANRGVIKASVKIVLAAQVDESGGPSLSLVSADFGPLPVPDGMLEGMSGMLDEAFTGQFGPIATGLRIDGILISDGLMAISGKIK